MKETVLDVLMYLCDRYLDDEADVDSDQDELRDELVEAGFPGEEIDKAFTWLESLGTEQETPAAGTRTTSIRVFTAKESERLSSECRGFLLFMEQAGVLDGPTRERVIDKVMALDAVGIELEQLKWVVLMVLFNQPGREAVSSWMEDLLIDHHVGLLH